MSESMPELAEILAANIARLRREYPSTDGLSVRVFAELVGVSKSTVSAWESGRQEVPVRRLPIIAQVLRVPVSQLLMAPPDGVPPRPMQLGELREALVRIMDLEGCHGANMHESKDVLVHVDGAYLRLANVQPAFHNGRFALVLVAGAHDPESGSPAWYAEHPEAAAEARSYADGAAA
jgi:transcriptional regulator with XRE-family HTH domain